MKKMLTILLTVWLAGVVSRAQELPALPFVADLGDPAHFTEEARALLPSYDLRDSASFLAGSYFMQSYSARFGSLPEGRFAKGFTDFQGVDPRVFAQEIAYGFGLGTGVLDGFEVAPERLDSLASLESRTAAETDSLAYLLGVSLAYAAAADYLDPDRVLYGANHSVSRDQDRFPPVYERYSEVRQQATRLNIRMQGDTFYKAAGKVGFRRIPSQYLRTKGDSNKVPLYRYLEEADPDSYRIRLGDGCVIDYTIRHVDGTLIDKDVMVIDSLDDQDFIKGMVAAILMLRYGDVIEVVIPPAFAYNSWDVPNEWDASRSIAPYETLVATVSLVMEDIE